MEESRREMEREMQQEIAKEVEKKVTNWVTVAITVLITVAVTFVIAVVAFKVVWAWVVPDVFAGAVDQGLIRGDLSWASAAKLAVLAAVLSGFSPSLSGAFKQRS